MAKKVGTIYLSIESASYNLGCRWHHLFPKFTYLQLTKRVITFLGWIQSTPHSAQPPSSLSRLRERWRRDSWDPRPVQPGQPQAPSVKRLCPAPDKTRKSGEERESESTLNPVSWKTFLLPGKQLPLCPGISKDIFYTFSPQ